MPFVAAGPRVRAAVLGLGGVLASAQAAARITVPVEFLVQWDDERVPRAHSLALFDALASTEKTLHANPGEHGDLPWFRSTDSSLRFFIRHLGLRRPGLSRQAGAGPAGAAATATGIQLAARRAAARLAHEVSSIREASSGWPRRKASMAD